MQKNQNITAPKVGDSTFLAAQNLFKHVADFERSTGYSINKANEIIAAGIVNKWFSIRNYGCSIVVNTDLRRADGRIIGNFSGCVEFKSSKQGSPSFQFAPDFLYTNHSCMVMTVFRERMPTKIFLAIALGKEKRSMETLAEMLQLDRERLTYNKTRGDRLCIFATGREKRGSRKVYAPGLDEKINGVQWSKLDAILEIPEAEINELLQNV